MRRQPQARYRTLFSGDRTPSDSLTCGVATVGPDAPLPLHWPTHAEVHYGLEGEARVTAGGREFLLSDGVALFIPGDVEHAVHPDRPARFLFALAANTYSDVGYVYLNNV